MRNCDSATVYFLAGLCLIWLCGCNADKGPSTPTKAELAPRITKGKEFIATLQSMPPDKRQAYVAQHQDIVQSLSTTGDPQLTTQFMQLMRESQPKK